MRDEMKGRDSVRTRRGVKHSSFVSTVMSGYPNGKIRGASGSSVDGGYGLLLSCNRTEQGSVSGNLFENE